MRQSGSNVQMMHIRRLLDAIEAGDISIPDFQRDFDWSEADVKELLITVFAGWPAGSLLLLDARNRIFQLRSIEDGPQVSQNPTFAILDGQQRLTSLYHAFFNKGNAVYAVDLRPDDRQDLDDRIVSFSRAQWERAGNSKLEMQATKYLLPVSKLRTASEFFEWRDLIIERTALSRQAEVKKHLTEFYTRNLSAVHEYEFPAVVLESSLDPEAIARIFERVNRTGLKLNAFDLMVAKTYRSDWNLRDRWIELREHFPNISAYLGDDGMPLLQAIALRESLDVRKSSVLALDRATVHNSWDRAGMAAADAVDFLLSKCYALRPEFVPYQNTIALLTALGMEGELRTMAGELEGWFWQSAFERSFDVAANTRLVAHYRALRNGSARRMFTPEVEIDLFASNKKNARVHWAAVSCVLAQSLKDTNYMDKQYAFDELEPAFVFSREEVPSIVDFMSDDPLYIDYYRSVLNMILVPKAHVAAISRLGAVESIAYMRDKGLQELARAQLHDAYECANDYKAYYVMRNQAISNFVRARAILGGGISFAVHTT